MHEAANLAEAAGNHDDGHARTCDPRQILMCNVPVCWFAQLVARRKVDPELKALEQPIFLFGHLRVDDASPRGEPLYVTSEQ